jgi:hypothetical protein
MGADGDTMHLSLTGVPYNTDVEDLLRALQNTLRILQVKSLEIEDMEVEHSALVLDWRIIEYAWRTIYENGGDRIIVKHRDRIDDLDRSAYLEAFKSHNIPVKLEIRSGSPQEAIIAVDDQI